MLNQLTISKLAAKLSTGEVSARQAMQSCLDQIARVDGEIHAFLSHDAADALAQADVADKALAGGKVPADKPLLGVPIAVKDVLAVKGQPLNCGSKILGNFVSLYDATAIEKLKAAGAVIFGRLNMDEFAMGSSTENSAFGTTKNPWDTSRIPGGSSGGSAAAVAADECIASLGTDTGGSIRQPAALCGCVGLKPTYGRISRYGLVAFASSLDQIGPFTKDVRDTATLLGVMSGVDHRDSTSIPQPVPNYVAALNGEIKGLRLGLPKEYMIGGMNPEVKQAVDLAVKQLEKLGAEIVEISLPHTDYAVATYYIVATAEASANLARFDGIRYGDARQWRQPGRTLQQDARCRFWRGSEAAHHSRHLRFEQRILRRLLFARPESAHAHSAGFSEGVRKSGRHRDAHHADSGVQSRREIRRSVADVSLRHLHHFLQPRRNPRDQPSVRIHLEPAASSRLATARKTVWRRDDFKNCPRLRANDLVAHGETDPLGKFWRKDGRCSNSLLRIN